MSNNLTVKDIEMDPESKATAVRAMIAVVDIQLLKAEFAVRLREFLGIDRFVQLDRAGWVDVLIDEINAEIASAQRRLIAKFNQLDTLEHKSEKPTCSSTK